MKIYILATTEYISLAKNIVKEIEGVKINSDYEIGTGSVGYDRNRIKSAYIILALIDDKFLESRYLKFELELAKNIVKKNRNKMLIPVVSNQMTVPKWMQEMLYIPCDFKSEHDIYKAKSMIKSILENIKYIQKIAYKDEKNEYQTKTSSIIILTVLMEIFVFFVLVLYKNMSFTLSDGEGYISKWIIFMVIMLSILTLTTSYLSIIRRRKHEDDEKEIAAYSERLKNAIVIEDINKEEQLNSENKNNIDAIGRMMINLEDIKEFYTWSQKQAKASFILAVVMCIFGFSLIVIAIILGVMLKLELRMSIIPAISGVVTELIAGTALVVYRHSLLQLNHYHKALHEDERFLSSVNLLGKFSNVRDQDEMLREIIRSEIQMNLKTLKTGSELETECP